MPTLLIFASRGATRELKLAHAQQIDMSKLRCIYIYIDIDIDIAYKREEGTLLQGKAIAKYRHAGSRGM